jgi:hypothetical protein
MATTTPNFGWSVPTSSDLVKNGAVAIETLGDSIDASLVDLKGGTTDQVLAKNSNTDMDFKWVSDATGMTNPMTTTGDVIYSSSGSTPARLGIGTAGQVLQVNSGATAPEWASPAASSFVGVRVNKSAGQSLVTNTFTVATWDQEDFDTNSMHDNVTNNSRLTVPSGKGGYYLITGVMSYATNGTGYRRSFFTKNGVFANIGANTQINGSTGQPETLTSSFVVALSAGDYVEMQLFQTSGGALSTDAGENTSFGISYLGA